MHEQVNQQERGEERWVPDRLVRKYGLLKVNGEANLPSSRAVQATVMSHVLRGRRSLALKSKMRPSFL